MAEATRTFFLRLRRGDPEREEARRLLQDGIQQTRAAIHQAYAAFNTAEDPDLIEAYVYEINALQAKHSYLLRQMRQLEEHRP